MAVDDGGAAALLDRAPCWTPGSSPELPQLSAEEEARLLQGERVQRQTLVEGVGSGYAVQHIRAEPDTVWTCMRDFDSYDSLIGTVKRVTAYEPEVQVPGTVCYNFLVSRIRLQLNVRWRVDDDQRYASWTLERPSWVLTDSSGFWHVEDVGGGMVRVWFFAAVTLKKRVPGFVVGLVSRLGLRKACSWWEDV